MKARLNMEKEMVKGPMSTGTVTNFGESGKTTKKSWENTSSSLERFFRENLKKEK